MSKTLMGKVISINISEKKGVVKEEIPEGILVQEHGLKDDAHAGKWHRQVSLLGTESVEKMKKMNVKGLCHGSFAENITTQGIELYSLPIGTKLYIGDTVQEVTQIGKECHDGCAIKVQVGQCVMPKEGIFTRVLIGGKIQKNDEIKVVIEGE